MERKGNRKIGKREIVPEVNENEAKKCNNVSAGQRKGSEID